MLHRFYGVTKDGVYFCVQVKEDKRTSRKDLMSVFEGYSQGFAGFRRRRPERMVGNRGCGMEWFPPPGGLSRWVT